MILFWARADLRLVDNPALWHAAQRARQTNQPLVALYVFSVPQWQQHDYGHSRIAFELHMVQSFLEALRLCNVPLAVLSIDYYKNIPAQLSALCQQYDIQEVYANRQYEWNEVRRDRACIQALRQEQVIMHWFHDQCLVAPDVLLNKQGQPYQVFTPYKKAVYAHLAQQPVRLMPAPIPVNATMNTHSALVLWNKSSLVQHAHVNVQQCINTCIQQSSTVLSALKDHPATIEDALQRLERFVASAVGDYEMQRNHPALVATSGLSPYLAVGALSAKQCMVALHARYPYTNPLQMPSSVACWVSELVWRDFYRYVMVHFAWVGQCKSFRPAYDRMQWDNSVQRFDAWKNGQTGYPLVDAAMRCLQQTHYLHNRLRMVVAMFLIKDLLVDWRWGERYFAQQLIDFDFCSNNGGWQWCAGCGTDAAPYFRIFNPYQQSKNFDPDAVFIRQWVPEVAAWTNAQIHSSTRVWADQSYPLPIVSHAEARQETLARYSQIQH